MLVLAFPSRPAFHILQHSCRMKSTWPLSGCCECCTLPSSLLIPSFPVLVLFVRAVPRSAPWRATVKRQLHVHSLHLWYTDEGRAAYIHICALITDFYSAEKRNKTNGQTTGAQFSASTWPSSRIVLSKQVAKKGLEFKSHTLMLPYSL